MKKLLSGLFVLALTLSTTSNIFAQHKINEIEIQKDMVLDGGTLLPHETFTFTMTPAQVEDNTVLDYLEVKPGLDLNEFNTITISYNENEEELSKKAAFNLSHLTFDKEAAIYRYEIKEISNQNDAITYDNTSYIVDVYVTNNGDIEYVIPKDASASSKTPIIFTNTYETETLEISKTVEGIFADESKDFNFKLTLDECSTLPAQTLLQATKTLNDGTLEPITFTVGIENNFTLKHNENISIHNLPQGMTYHISEDEAIGYTSEITDSDNGVMSDDGATVHFVNTKVETVETGIMLNTAPYLVSIGAFLMGLAMIVVIKKNKAEDKC